MNKKRREKRDLFDKGWELRNTLITIFNNHTYHEDGERWLTERGYEKLKKIIK